MNFSGQSRVFLFHEESHYYLRINSLTLSFYDLLLHSHKNIERMPKTTSLKPSLN